MVEIVSKRTVTKDTVEKKQSMKNSKSRTLARISRITIY
ncbi:hypothetical protein LEP1GSC018_0728 [Leptospira kirschneri str. 2008720114]|uniref:Uncharacterized protein n=1 Tax=Leptospira kirschneri str. H1 TaxID=1049966 RepID=A0A0E2AXN2_9LEPT|nr:hypothetical protein LEP1GSC081_0138 [Leptospira kirschneri str. H1]EKO60412.1 hypothetical protein LEP1GSC082_2069 [Leptospira kirschneri str. H2]EKP03854.1 hypothetical protein LEP1GSC018_0728 [Leptospira kirschneri str. 2008720114]